MKPLMKYHGAKWRIAPWIIQYMPAHKCYVEPFGGSAAVLLQKGRAVSEVYNDINSELVNVFQVVRNYPEQLAGAIDLTLYSREELELAYEPTEDKIEQARRFLVRSQLAISTTSLNEKTGFRSKINKGDYSSQPTTWAKLPGIIFEVRNRLNNVIIENTNWANLLPRYDQSKTLWFLDPPYPNGTRTSASNRRGYAHDFTEENHKAMLCQANSLKGFVMISSYKNELYDEYLKGWHIVQTKGFSDSMSKSRPTETLYLNYRPQSLLF